MKLSDRITYSECGQTRQWLFVLFGKPYRLTIDDTGWRFMRAKERSTQILTSLTVEREPWSVTIARLEAEEKSWPILPENYAKETVV